MEQNAPQVKNIQKYHQHFRKQSQFIKFEPRRDRTCNDKICYVMFFIILAVFLAIGIYFMKSTDIRKIIKSAMQNQEYSGYVQAAQMANGFKFQNLKPAIPIIAGMMSLTVIMALMFLFLLVKFPKCIFGFMLILGGLVIGALAFLFFYIRSFVPAIIMCVVGALLIIVVCCSMKRVMTGFALLNVASKFLSEKPSTFVAPIVVLFFIVVFEVFWALSLAGIQIYTGNAQTQQQLNNQKTINYCISFCWAFFKMFYSCFFYYCNSFLIATAAGIWYYNSQQNYIPRAIARILRYHLGSFTFASMIVGLVSLTRKYTQQQSNQGLGVATFCVCALGCCIKYMQDLLQTLNHHAIIVMSVTGQDYFNSARSTLSLVFNNFPLFFLVDLMNRVITITGIIFICGVPGIIGFFLLRGTAQNPDDILTQAVGTVIIILFGALIGAIFLSVLSEALSCMFVFFCIDRRFIQYGYPTPDRAPQPIKQIFHDITPYVGGQYNEHYDVRRSQNPEQQNISSQNHNYVSHVRQTQPQDTHSSRPGFF